MYLSLSLFEADVLTCGRYVDTISLKYSLSDEAMFIVSVNMVALSTCNFGGGRTVYLGSSSSIYWKTCLQSVSLIQWHSANGTMSTKWDTFQKQI